MTPEPTTTDLLGEIITWDAQSAEIDVQKIRQALTDTGLDTDYARDLSTKSAFSRAATHLKENRTIDKVVENAKAQEITFQLTRKAVNDGVMQFDYETQITLNTQSGDISCGIPEIEAQAQALFAHAMQVRTATDITRMVQKMFKDRADLFPINPSKGIAYFVPDAHKGFTSKVKDFMDKVGGTLWLFPVPKGTDHGNASVRDAVSNGLEALLAELNEAVEQWDDSTRNDTVKRKLEHWRAIKHKAESYATYLEANQQAVLDKIADAKAALVAKYTEIRPDSELANKPSPGPAIA